MIGTTLMRLLQHATLAGLVGLVTLPAQADNALLQDGSGLFNVFVEETHTTWSRPLKVRFKPHSFRYDYRNNSVSPLLGFSNYYWIDATVETSATVGKEEARALMRENGWHRHSPPRQVVLKAFTPAPPTPAPTPIPTPDPTRVADEALAMEARIQEQLDIFIEEQSRLSNKIRFDQSMKILTDNEAKKQRLQLLESQLEILQKHYPQDHSLVKSARDALKHHSERVQESGLFNSEH